MSVEGAFIKKRQDPNDPLQYKYVLESDCEKSIKEISNKIIPISTYHD